MTEQRLTEQLRLVSLVARLGPEELTIPCGVVQQRSQRGVAAPTE